LKHQRHFEPRNRSREASQTRTLIADIDRVVEILNSDIADEEAISGILDRSHAEYSILARTLTARRDNLRGTIAALEKRLSDLPVEAFRAAVHSAKCQSATVSILAFEG
jgi:hypothetical protein